ncbi:MAG: CPBP family intramembrane metalloprotease [Clostridia bacterium]|nr:CPBP family intramembrane metalloprotease [Clostridia bacterium]
MNQFFQQSPYGKIPVEFGDNFFEIKGETPNRTEKRQLMLLSTLVGLGVIFFIALQQTVPYIFVWLGVGPIYLSNQLAQAAIEALISIFCIFIPFAIIYRVISKRISSETEILPFKKPVSQKVFGVAIAMGILALLLSNYLTGVFIFYMDSIGVKFTAPETQKFSGGTATFLFYIIRGAMVPALIEEFALRGVVMQPLRKFGDKFAIVMSSLIFAVMHGNMVQAPFAFILGCAIGYLVIITGTLWTGVIIHFTNNAFSVVMSVVSTQMDYDIYFKVYSIFSVAALLIGGAATALFIFNRSQYPYLKSRGGVTRDLKRKYFRSASKTYLLNPALLVALGILIYNMADYISFGG